MLKEFLQNLKRLLRGERAPKPEPVPPVRCFGCDEPIQGSGFSAFGELWCAKSCVPPILESRLAGDPGG